jgi:DNA-binding ferritin-like protein (Dps family)
VPTPNTNEEHALIELQDLQECKEEALVVVPNTDSDDFYDAYKSHYQYHLSVGEVSVMSLYKACLNLIKAAAMDNKKAIAQLQSEQDRFLSHEFTKALDSEFSTRLKAFNTKSRSTEQLIYFILFEKIPNNLFKLY